MSTPGERDSPQRRVLLLAAQAFALGLTTAWILIPASAIFLAAYGPRLLPVTYIGAAVLGAGASVQLSRALRHHSVPTVAARVLTGLAIALTVSWLVLTTWGGDWVSFALLVLIPIVVPVGFVFVVGQAGILLDVRTLKALYARVVAGFALGFVAGGLAGPLILTLRPHTEDLLLAATVAACLFLGLVLGTRHRYTSALSVVAVSLKKKERPTVRSLTRHRYVMLIVAFQMLSAVESQWLDFLVFDRAAQRYQDQAELARFISRFSAIAYGADILFLVLVAGLLLRRFGLRYGLTANAIGVLTVLVAILLSGSILGSGATLVFVMIVAARVTDLTFSDGTSRTSLSAAYQAVPGRLRSVAQAAVEGLAVPVAIGASGIGLLVVEAAGATNGLALPVLTAIVVIAWVVVAVLLFREYRVSLLANLRGRTLDAAELDIEDTSSLQIIDRLVESDDERDVRLGLDILTIAQHPELPTRLQRLVVDDRVLVRTDALERLVDLAPHMAADAARDGLTDGSSKVRAACIRVLGSIPGASGSIISHLDDPATEVKVAVAFAVSRTGDAADRTAVSRELNRLATSSSADERSIAGAMFAADAPGSGMDRDLLTTLLSDRDPSVVTTALGALRTPDDDGLLDRLVVHLEDRHTAAAAVDALGRFGHAALLVIDQRLQTAGSDRLVDESLVRAARQIGGPRAIEVLRGHVDHPDRELGLAVMTALAVIGRTEARRAPAAADSSTSPSDGLIALGADLEHATRALRVLDAFAATPNATLQNAAMRYELTLAQSRLLAALSVRHGTRDMRRVVYQLAQRDARPRALALEWLDLALTGSDRAVVTLLEPGLSDRERLNALARWFPIPAAGPREILIELIRDEHGEWRRPWIAACALHTAGGMSPEDFAAVIAATPGPRTDTDDFDIVIETRATLVARDSDRRRDARRVLHRGPHHDGKTEDVGA